MDSATNDIPNIETASVAGFLIVPCPCCVLPLTIMYDGFKFHARCDNKKCCKNIKEEQG